MTLFLTGTGYLSPSLRTLVRRGTTNLKGQDGHHQENDQVSTTKKMADLYFHFIYDRCNVANKNIFEDNKGSKNFQLPGIFVPLTWLY